MARRLAAYDPVAMPEAARVLGPRDDVTLMDRAEAALQDADALLIVTEWKEFRTPDFDRDQVFAEAACRAGRPQPPTTPGS